MIRAHASLVCHSSTKLPAGPRLAESRMENPIKSRCCFANEMFFHCPRQEERIKRRSVFDSVVKIDTIVLRVTACHCHCSTDLLLKLISRPTVAASERMATVIEDISRNQVSEQKAPKAAHLRLQEDIQERIVGENERPRQDWLEGQTSNFIMCWRRTYLATATAVTLHRRTARTNRRFASKYGGGNASAARFHHRLD